LTFAGGQGEVGIDNRGLNRWGMHFVEGKPYDGLLWLRSAEQVDVAVTLESDDGGRILAQSRVHVPGGDNWCRTPFTLVPRATALSRHLVPVLVQRLGSCRLRSLLRSGRFPRGAGVQHG